MTIAFIDCSAGIAGDMLLGALIDAGASIDAIKQGLSSMRSLNGEWDLTTTRVWKGPGRIAGTKAHVSSFYNHRSAPVPGKHHDHDHNHDHDHEHSHDHGHKRSNAEAWGDHGHSPKQHASDHHSHEHSHSHAHNHDQEHSRSHEHSHTHGGEPMRNLADIKTLVMQSTLSDWVKEKSIAAFTYLAEAEAHTHGTTIDEIHFHEVGAIDSIIDTVGSILAMDLLEVRAVYCSPLPFSSGTVECEHGLLPVPPPATFRLMIGVPVYPAPRGATGELVTPTGISLIKALVTAFSEPPLFVPTQTGVGAGTKEFPSHANIVRVTIGTPQHLSTSASSLTKEVEDDIVMLLETNIDDLNPQVLGYVQERLLDPQDDEGPLALDVWTQGIQMKKNRPGTLLSVLCLPKKEHRVTTLLFQETTTLGIRRNKRTRRTLERKMMTINAFDHEVDVKLGYLNGELMNLYPEYEHCKTIARVQGIPLVQVIHDVQQLTRWRLQEEGRVE